MYLNLIFVTPQNSNVGTDSPPPKKKTARKKKLFFGRKACLIEANAPIPKMQYLGLKSITT